MVVMNVLRRRSRVPIGWTVGAQAASRVNGGQNLPQPDAETEGDFIMAKSNEIQHLEQVGRGMQQPLKLIAERQCELRRQNERITFIGYRKCSLQGFLHRVTLRNRA